MFKLTGGAQAVAQDAFATSTQEDGIKVGQKITDDNGDIYRYVKAGEAITAGHLVQAPTPLTTAVQNVDVNTAAIGDTKLTVTAGAEAVAANALAGGLLVVNSGTAIGDSYSVKGNSAVSSGGGSMTVYLDSPIRATFGASDKVTIMQNPCNGVLEDTSSTLKPVGIALEDIASGSYGWVKSRGLIGALADETLTLGCWLTAGTSTAGAVEELDDVTAPITDNLVGYAVTVGADGEVRPIFVTCD